MSVYTKTFIPSTNISDLLPHLSKIYEEGWDFHLINILRHYNIQDKTYPYSVYNIDGVFIGIKQYNYQMFLDWYTDVVVIPIVLEKYKNVRIICKPYHKDKLLELKNLGFVEESNVKHFRDTHAFPKNLFSSDSDLILSKKED